MEEVTYLYTVNPRKPIKGITGVSILRNPKSLQLTKEDVYTCLKTASVYRRFANEGLIKRVTTANVDRLHNDKYMDEEEYEKFLINQSSAQQKTVTIHEDEKKETEVKFEDIKVESDDDTNVEKNEIHDDEEDFVDEEKK